MLARMWKNQKPCDQLWEQTDEKAEGLQGCPQCAPTLPGRGHTQMLPSSKSNVSTRSVTTAVQQQEEQLRGPGPTPQVSPPFYSLGS